MGMMQALQDVGSSITGSIHKAMLCVKKEAQPGMAPGSTNLEFRAKLVSNSASLLGGGGGGIKSFAQVRTTAAASGYHVMQVKYNPSSIQFSTQGGSYMQSGPGGGGVNQITQIVMPSQTTMRVELLFDDVNIPDAFMWEKFSLSAGNLVSSVSGIVKQVKGNGYSIQPQVDGLVALITQSESRQVVFYWSELAFAGEVTAVDAVYTMFNPSGHPIRGTVTLSIHQSEAELGKGDRAYWNKAFDKLFGDYSQNQDNSGENWTNMVGNLLNL